MYKQNFNNFEFADPQEEWRSKNGGRIKEEQSQTEVRASTSPEEDPFNNSDKLTIKSMSEMDSGSESFIVQKGRSGSPYSYSGPMTSTPKAASHTKNGRPTRDSDSWIQPKVESSRLQPKKESPSQQTDVLAIEAEYKFRPKTTSPQPLKARPPRDVESRLEPQNLTDQFTRDSGYVSNQGSAFESTSPHKVQNATPLKPQAFKKNPIPSPRRLMLEGAQRSLEAQEQQEKQGEQEKRESDREDAARARRSSPANPFPGRLMYLDENCTLHEVEDEHTIKELLKKSTISGLGKNMDDTLQHFRTIPIDRLYHFASIGQHLGFLQRNDLFFDVVIHVHNQSFKAHRVILSCFSKYFADSFTASVGKTTKHPMEIKLNGITINAFKIFLEFIYTGVLEMKPEIVGELSLAAEFLEINCLKEKTLEFLGFLTPDQALVVIETGNIPHTSELYRISYETVMAHFSDCYDTNAFNNLSLENVCTILGDDRLVIFTEMDVFWASLKWIASRMTERSPYLNKIMECVRFPYLSQAEIFKCLEATDLLRKSEKCKEFLINANWIISSEERNQADLLNLPKPPRRLCFRRGQTESDNETFVSMVEDVSVSMPELRQAFSCEVYNHTEPEKTKIADAIEPKKVPSHLCTADIIAFGGFQHDSKNSHTDKQMQRYSTKVEQWRYFGELPAPRHHHAVAILGGSIYLAGGAIPKRKVLHIKEKATETLFQYDIEQKSWKLCGPMNSCRMFFKLIPLYGMLYALAGEDDRHQILSCAECYNPKTNGWIYVSSMNWPRKGFAAAACEGKIYVAGGEGRSVCKRAPLPILQSMESFDPRSNQWTSLQGLKIPRCYASMVSIHSTLYLCGGATRAFESSGPKQCRHEPMISVGWVEIYDVKTNEWQYKSEMVTSRYNHGEAVIGSKIYLLGGISTTGKKVLKSVECLDTKTHTWDNSIQDLLLPAKWVASVTLPLSKAE